MPIHNELGEGGLNNSLSKRLAIPGGAPAPALEPGIFPTINLGVAWEELAFNQGWRRWQTVMRQTQGAGVANRYLLNNPAGSNVLVVIEELWWGTASLDNVRLDGGYGNLAALANGAVAEFRDTRQTPSGAGALITSSGTGAPLAATAAMLRVLGGTTQRVPGGPWLLWNTGHLLIGGEALNIENELTVVWSERGMTRGEQLG